MSLETATEFERYARDCVELAHQPDVPPEIRKQLLQMARNGCRPEWPRKTRDLIAISSPI